MQPGPAFFYFRTSDMLQDGLQNDGFLEVGIENTSGWNFKDLEGMLGNSKALKRNNRESKGILIDPLMAPPFF
jgi:hypothetical protein